MSPTHEDILRDRNKASLCALFFFFNTLPLAHNIIAAIYPVTETEDPLKGHVVMTVSARSQIDMSDTSQRRSRQERAEVTLEAEPG